MKRSLSIFVVLIITAILSGCILSKTPKTNDVQIPLRDQLTFSVNVFPTGGTFAWTLDGAPLVNTGKSYVYISEAGNHTLVVKSKHIFGTDTQTWNITTPDPITDLLNSMVYIPAGTFMMGSTDDEYGRAQYTTPVHEVTLQAFDIGAYEVTQAQYEAVMGTNPSYFQGTGYPDSVNRPVEQVWYYEARAFCTALSALTGRTFTLPSEAQWEYACRAGTTTLYSYGDSDAMLGNYAWWWENSGNQTHSIGTKSPNPWGLYDMHGNVWEWCLDSWHDNYVGAPTDGSAWEPETSWNRVIRGGCWDNDQEIGGPWPFRSANRNILNTEPGNGIIFGFRVVEIP